MATRTQKKITKAPKKTKATIEETVNQQAEQAMAELEESETFENDGDTGLTLNAFGRDTDTENFAEEDVFEEGFNRARVKNTAPKFHIKKNSQFLTVKGYPYSWEKLQADYGPGYYHVVAKAMNTGVILKQQTEMVGDPNEGKPVIEESNHDANGKPDTQLAILAMMNQIQERAELRAANESKGVESSLATVMQTVMTAQAESTKLMMTMMNESNKQTQTLLLAMMDKNSKPPGPDPMLTLVTTLLTQKPDNRDGFTMASVMKMVQDAETRAETRATKNYELIDKKANDLADMKAEAMGSGEGDGEESLTKSIIKGFLPILPQIIAAQGQGQQATTEQQRLFMEQQHRANNPALNEGFVEPALRKGVGSNGQAQRPPQPVQRPVQAGPRTVQAAPTQGGTANPAQVVQKVPEVVVPASEIITDGRLKDQVMQMCIPDIGQALMNGLPASTIVEPLLLKLEKEGISRQTIANTFSLEDFYAVATNHNLPEEVKPWLKDFHESIQKAVFGDKSSGKVVAGSAPAVEILPPEPVKHGTNGAATAGPGKPVAASRGKPAARGAGTKSQPNP